MGLGSSDIDFGSGSGIFEQNRPQKSTNVVYVLRVGNGYDSTCECRGQLVQTYEQAPAYMQCGLGHIFSDIQRAQNHAHTQCSRIAPKMEK